MNAAILYILALFSITIILDIWLVSRWKVYKKLRNEKLSIDKATLLQQVFLDEPIRSWRESRIGTFIRKYKLQYYLELFLLALWAIYLGMNYLNFDPNRIPLGREFGSAIASNYLWTQVQHCGWCAVWNGSQRGGFPAFADIQGSMLHPLVIFTTLVFGIVNGAKVTIVISFWLAGLAQWWIARELNLGFIPRIWSAGIAIVGGHLAGRMELGVYGVVLSTASVSLVFAALLRIAKDNNLHNALLLGICSALAIVSGQGYIQVGMIAILPVFILFYGGRKSTRSVWLNYVMTGLIAFLLSAPLLVPLAHFSPNIAKAQDIDFKAAQPLSYMVLNLVIDDVRYFQTNLLGKLPYPYLYTLYIGWVPVVLFVFALGHFEDKDKKLLWFMVAGAAMEFLIGSAVLLRLLVKVWPALSGIRHPPQIAGLAIPLILGVSAYGLEKLLNMKFPGSLGNLINWQTITRWIIGISLIYSLGSCMKFALVWTETVEVTDDLFQTLEKLKTPDLQWVNPPFGEHVYVEPAIALGLKLSPGIITWDWKNRIMPSPYIDSDRKNPIKSYSDLSAGISEIQFHYHPNNKYAYVERTDGIKAPCMAKGSGGFIEVACKTETPGTLHVEENMWDGWNAWMDGQKIGLIENDRLTVPIPAGEHNFLFRYLPWDVPLGFALFVVGVILCIWLWIRGVSNKTFDNIS